MAHDNLYSDIVSIVNHKRRCSKHSNYIGGNSNNKRKKDTNKHIITLSR